MEMNINDIKDRLKNDLKPSRYEHVLRVTDEALELNELLNLGINRDKVLYSAILHDCCKNVEEKYFNLLKEKYNLDKEYIFEDLAISHAKLGVYVAKDIYGIEDIEILEAIRWHTTGKEDMTLLEKLIFIADFTEPGRDFEDSKLVRKKVIEDLDGGVLLCLNLSIKHLVEKNVIIDIDTLKARNYLLRRINE